MRASSGRPVVVLVILLLAACGLTSCTSGEAPTAPAAAAQDTVRFASYDFQENQILAEVYAEAARRAGVAVTVQHGVGTREVAGPALEQGAVDVVVDYLGAALTFFRPDTPPAGLTPAQLHAALGPTLAGRGVTVLTPAAAEDQDGFAVTADFAAQHRVSRLSDLTALAPDLVFGAPPECAERPLCLPGLREVYGVEFGKVLPMPSRPATVEALLAGEIDVGLLETTDARFAVSPIRLLADDRGLQPHQNVVPLVRTEVVERQGERLTAALDAVSARLTTRDLIQLNRAVEIDGLSLPDAAKQWWDEG